MDLTTTKTSLIRAAERALDTHRGADSVAVLWQGLGESADAYRSKVEVARTRLPDNRLLVAVCTPRILSSYGGVRVVELPPKALALFHPSNPRRYRVLRGGRGAAKSWSIARVLLVKAVERPTRVLCCREFQHSIEESAHKLLSDTIDVLGLSRYFAIQARSITATNGSEFIFEGLYANVSKIRSLEGVDICWVEEAAKVSENSWSVLTPTIRRPGSEIWINYNPEGADDPTHVRFSLSPPPDCELVHVTWESNPWFPPVLERERQYLLRVDSDAHAHIWGGACRTVSEAQILKGKYTVEAFERQPQWDGPYLGLDFGFSQDPTAAVKCWVADCRLYVEYECWAIGCDIDATPRLLDAIPDARKYLMRADCARPETISYLRNHGFPNCIGVEKWPNSVEDGVAFLRAFEKIVIHPRCVHVLEEARLYSYKVDRLSGDVLPDIVDRHNHTWDAVRYALMPLIRARGAGLLAFYAQETEKMALAAKDDDDPHHPVERILLNGATAPRLPFERAKAEGGRVADMESPWHRP